MERSRVMVNAGRLAAAVLIALTTTLAWLAPVARAQVADTEGTDVIWYEEPIDPGEDIERWWGVAGAVICGAELRIIRVAPAIGMNPYMIAGGLAGCLLAGLDVLTTQ